MLAVDEETETTETTEATTLELPRLEVEHVNLVREKIRQHIAQARSHERAAADLWRRTLELIGEAAGQEIPPTAQLLEDDEGGMRLEWGDHVRGPSRPAGQ